MDKTISVIIPVYNVATYLPECMDSVLSQSYSDLEVIVIDDGSTDESGQICDTYAARDSRVRVIHQQNGGAAAAKNAGLREATGYYLTFADSDDVVEEGAYEYMARTLEEHDADVIQCAFRDVYVDRTADFITLPELKTFDVKDYLLRYTTDWTCGLLWDKLYKRELFNGIFFEEGHIVDDDFFTYQGVLNAAKVVHSPCIVYNYRKRASSVTLRKEYQERTIGDRLDYLGQRRKKIADKFPELQGVFDEHYLTMLQWMAMDPFVTKTLVKRIQRMIGRFFKEEHARIDWRQWWNARKLQFTGADRVLKRKGAMPTENKTEQYFA